MNVYLGVNNSAKIILLVPGVMWGWLERMTIFRQTTAYTPWRCGWWLSGGASGWAGTRLGLPLLDFSDSSCLSQVTETSHRLLGNGGDNECCLCKGTTNQEVVPSSAFQDRFPPSTALHLIEPTKCRSSPLISRVHVLTDGDGVSGEAETHAGQSLPLIQGAQPASL